jgi:hypothetical protein
MEYIKEGRGTYISKAANASMTDEQKAQRSAKRR